MHKKIKEEINAVLFFIFLQNITQSIVPNIEISYTTNGFRATCNDCEIQIYKV